VSLPGILHSLFAQPTFHWRPDSFLMSVASVFIFTLVGIVLSIIGFKLWDRITPGSLEVEICQKQNIAAAILGAAIILGVSIIVAAAMIG
jgi:putative membrane protein